MEWKPSLLGEPALHDHAPDDRFAMPGRDRRSQELTGKLQAEKQRLRIK